MTTMLHSRLRQRLLAGAATLALGTASSAYAGPLADAEPEARFAVGVTTNFVRDFSKPFDAWGRKYKTDEYRAWLDEVDALGTPRTTVTKIYYPSPQGDGATDHGLENVVPSQLPAAAEGEAITVTGLYFGKEMLAKMAFSDDAAPEEIYMAHEGAPLAEGKFPLVIMVHGLGGSLNTWASAAEHLAAQGYIVVTVTMTSDSAVAPVFEDPESPWVKQATPEEIQAAYVLRAQNSFGTIFRNWYAMLFDYHEPIEFGNWPDPKTLNPATAEGSRRVGQLMADLFDQRVEDVERVITEMKYFNDTPLDCMVGLVTEQNPKPLCDGFFSGAIDVDNIGVMGHSLGSMTAQASAAFLGDVDTAVGFNNGLPRTWEPYGGLPGDPDAEVPTGVEKPFLQVIGSDDYFIYNVFRKVLWTSIKESGGDPKEHWIIESEQTWPTEDNPQAEATAAYERATGEKMLVTFTDEDHSTAVDDWEGVYEPGRKLTANRLPPSPDAPIEEYEVLGWVEEDGQQVYMPHLMRNYYLANWFDWTLKGDDEARARLTNHPFPKGVKQIREEGVSN